MADGKLKSIGGKMKIKASNGRWIAVEEPGRYGDGGGLYLKMTSAEACSWQFRYIHRGTGRSIWLGLGAEKDVTLAEAREKARECRRLLAQGLDPLAARRAARAAAKAMTFEQVADLYLADHEATWRNEKHRWQWRQTLGIANAEFGKQAISEIETGAVLKVLKPLWPTKPETASRLRGRIEAVIDYATAHGWRTGENPARWKGHLVNVLPRPTKVRAVEHHAALPWREIGTFMGALREQEGVAARALEFTVMTAARTGEVIGARWPEIDMQTAIWTVPGERMKAGREHRVPLSKAALAVLRAVLPLRNNGAGDFVFPGARAHRPLSNMAMVMLLRRMKHADLTVHGFRSAFRDWVAEATNFPRELAEKALAHVLESKVEEAYQRGDLFTKRARLMQAWAEFCAKPPAAAADNVRHLRERRQEAQV